MPSTDTELPVTGGDAKRAYVRGVFEQIAPRYDLLNHVLSLNADRRWRRKAVAVARNPNSQPPPPRWGRSGR